MSSGTVRLLVMGVPLIIWAGIFIYIIVLDRAVARLERGAGSEEDD